MRLLAAVLLLATFFLTPIPGKPAQSGTATPRAVGIKFTSRALTGQTTGQSVTAQGTEETTSFIESDRRREESRPAMHAIHADGSLDTRPRPRLVDIARCDLGQAFELNLEDEQYAAESYPRFTLTKEQMEARQKEIKEWKEKRDKFFQKAVPWMPTVRQETATVDTGERKNFYGHEARHLIKTWKQTPLVGSHLDPADSVTDGWYIDLNTTISCESRWPRTNLEPRHEYYAAGAERYEVIDDGILETAFGIEGKSTSRSIVTSPDGTKRPSVYNSEEKITEFYEGPLDPALFEVPSSFRKVKEVRNEPPLTLADRWYFTTAWVKSLFQ